MSKPWGGVGAWAAEAEREEAEEREAASAAPTPEPQSFPSLKEATNSKQKKKKMTLSEFTLGYNSGGGYAASKTTDYGRLTPDEMMRLPTRPKERSADEMQFGRLGGGFSSYGRGTQGPNRGMRDRDDSDAAWGGGRRSYGGGFDEERRGPSSRASEYDQPSRADEVDNWAMAKKSVPTVDNSGRQNSRYGGLGAGGGMSRADEVDSWGAGKKPMQTTRSSTFGSGFRSSGPEPDRWTRGGGDGGGFPEERPKLILDPPRGDVQESAAAVKANKPNPFGLARPREEVLAEKGLDWKTLENEIDAKKTSRPGSSHSSRPSSAQSSRSEAVQQQEGMENVVKARPKVNPFGNAKPREVLLEEQGKDWRKIDLELEHRSIDRPETEDEKSLKEEIDHLKKETEKADSLKHEADGSPSILVSTLNKKERDLEMLIRDLDDKVRFGQRAAERLGSVGRTGSFSDRPQSRPGSTEGSRNMDFGERPRSRGTSDSWSRTGDERRSFQGARERGFLGNRDSDRPRSRERW